MIFRSPLVRNIALTFIFCLALAVRLYDLTDLPLDFHPTRQLLSAIKARALYYQTQPDGISTTQLEIGIRLAKFKAGVEPVVFERLVASTYRLTGEQLWVPRVYSILFWLVGGLFLYKLLRGFVSFEGALFSTAYYLFYPYAVIASRSFQPDPLMVMLVLAFWWMFSRWRLFPTWMNSILAGLLGGFAIFIKFSSVFFVIGAALGMALSQVRFRDLLRNRQVWLMTLLGILPAGLYLVDGILIRGSLGQQFVGRFIPSLLLNPLNYLSWQARASQAAGGLFIMVGLLAIVLVQRRDIRIFSYGLWSAYVLYGLFFNYHVATHDYYHLPFIPVVAASLAPVGDWFLSRVEESVSGIWTRSMVIIILVCGLLSNMLAVMSQMKSVDYRPQAVQWAEIGESIGDSRVIALTQDYGSRLEYWGWKTTAIWPTAGDLNYALLRGGGFSFENLFEEYSGKKDIFLVTDFEEFNRQNDLKKRLEGFYASSQGDGYILFDLNSPLSEDDK